MTIKWFGTYWPSGVCDESPRVPVPIGTKCCHCEESIEAGDSGMIYANGPAAHRNCALRQTIGSVAHVLGLCSCYRRDSTEGDPLGMTRRQAADAAVEVWERHQARSTPVSDPEIREVLEWERNWFQRSEGKSK
jgi:hypothetical protein